MTLEEIKQVATSLTISEMFALAEWLTESAHDRWDEQIAEDLAAGRLDKIIAEAEEAIRTGQTRLL
jgi:hypothetical protein